MATHVAFLQSLRVTFVPLLLLLFHHEHVTRKDLFVQAGAVSGLYLLCMGDGMSSLGGNLLALITGLLAAIAAITTPLALRHIGVPTLSFMNSACSLTLSVGAGVFSGMLVRTDWNLALKPQILLVVLFAGLIASGSGYLLQNTAQAHLSPKTVSVLHTVIQC